MTQPLKAFPSAIHQFLPECDTGDGITNAALFTQKILRTFGVLSEIFSAHIPDELTLSLRDYHNYKGKPGDILLVHHSLGTDHWEWIRQQAATKILIYHNITPSTYFEKDSPAIQRAEQGRAQLASGPALFKGAIGVSEYNTSELAALSYQPLATIPLLVDIEKIYSASWDRTILSQYKDTYNLLFVGRIAEHKKQHEIVELFAYFKRLLRKPARLLLVGGAQSPQYERYLAKIIRNFRLQEEVVLTGKVSDAQLYGYYRAANMFVSLSAHEGFGMPLIEAMCFDIPVVAYNAGNIGNTLGTSGVLFQKKCLPEMAACLKLLATHAGFRRRIKASQRDNISRFSVDRIRTQLHTFFESINIYFPTPPTPAHDTGRTLYQIEGPFDSSYSLALVNRELALGLQRNGHDVSLYSTDGPGDFTPDTAFLRGNPVIRSLFENQHAQKSAHVVIRNLYPPRVADARGAITVLAPYAWEESAFPTEWIADFNQHLDLVAVTSAFVQKVLIDNGLRTPCVVIGNGVDHILSTNPAPIAHDVGSGFRFLHISSAFPRKGIDVLLAAWGRAFYQTDAVTLIIKTFPNPHNTVLDQIAALKNNYPDHAPIIVIDDDLPAGALATLYTMCDAFVAPSRGEGFGLPIAEAMLFEKPVITTGYGGQADFCSAETAWLIDYHFAKAATHIGLSDSIWAEPSIAHLSQLMRTLYRAPVEEIQKKTLFAKETILSRFTWDAVAQRLVDAISALHKKPAFDHSPQVAWVTTWHTRCGIATYSEFLTSQLQTSRITIFANRAQDLICSDNARVFRCWEMGFEDTLEDVYSLAHSLAITSMVIQFNFAFFSLHALAQLIERLKIAGIKVHLFLHATADVEQTDFSASLGSIAATLTTVDRIFVHGLADVNRLKDFGLVDNVILFPHGVNLPIETHQPNGNALQNKRIIASYGFLLPHKGIVPLLHAFAGLLPQFPNLHLLLVNAMYPTQASKTERRCCEQAISTLGISTQVTMITDFLREEESLALLHAAECIIFPYQNTQESASGAVRQGLAAGRPVLCAPLPIFEDVADAVIFLPGTSTAEIQEGIREALSQPEKMAHQLNKQLQWCRDHHWPLLAQRLWHIICAIEDGFAPKNTVNAP